MKHKLNQMLLIKILKKIIRLFLQTPQDKLKKTLSIGKYSYYHPSLVVKNPRSTIGSFTSIAGGVILGLGQHPLTFLTTSPVVYYDNFMDFPQKSYPSISHEEYIPVTIGSDVWIGEGVKIMGGLSIGHGAVLGAGAVVTKDVPPYAIVGGIPAKVIRYRFPEKVIEELLDLQWWTLEDNIIATLPMENIDACLMELKKIRTHQSEPYER